MKIILISVLAGAVLSLPAQAKTIVTPETFARADVDLTLSNVVKEVGSNKFRHDRSLIPLDKQPAVTMNRDTIYSLGVFYVPKGTTITLPKSKDGRYQSAMIMQNDHYIDQVFYGAGVHEIKSATEFVGIAIRTQVDAANPDDVKYVNSLQDKIVVKLPKGAKAKPFVPGDWDMASLDALRAKYQEEAKALPNLNATSGARGTIDPAMQRLGVAVALGLLPPQDAVYIYRDYGLKGDKCYAATYQKPPFGDKGFFSFTMYGSDKYLHDEQSNLNNRVLKYNPDGSFTMHYGPAKACGTVANRLNTPGDNWYLGMRIYRPGQSVIDGKYVMPDPVMVAPKS
jgi:hypothetical protein